MQMRMRVPTFLRQLDGLSGIAGRETNRNEVKRSEGNIAFNYLSFFANSYLCRVDLSPFASAMRAPMSGGSVAQLETAPRARNVNLINQFIIFSESFHPECDARFFAFASFS